MDWPDVDPFKHIKKRSAVDADGSENRTGIKRTPLETRKIEISREKLFAEFQRQYTNIQQSQSESKERITFAHNREVVAGYRELLRSLEPTFFLTFMPGRMFRPETVRKSMIEFCKHIERRALGKKWSKLSDNRMWLIAFLEKPDITPHYQGLAVLPDRTGLFLEILGPEIWHKFYQTGEFEAEPIRQLEDSISYVTKDLHHHWAAENVFIYGPLKA